MPDLTLGLLGFLGSIGPMELLVIAGLGVLIFGHRLPKVARSLGRGITEFKKGLKDVRDLDTDTDAEDAGDERPRRAARSAKTAATSSRRRRRRREDSDE